MFKQKGFFSSARALLCVAGCISFVFNFAGVNAQTKRLPGATQIGGTAPFVTATLTDSFADSNGNGRAAAGEEVTYTATIANSGTSDATNVSFTNTIDANTTLVPGSVQVQSDFSYYAFHCWIDTSGGGAGGCPGTANPYGATDAYFNAIIGGYANVRTSNVSYNSQSEIFQFDANVTNLMTNAMGTVDGTTLDPNGVRLFVTNMQVVTGSGTPSIANADGTAQFTAPNQPYFQYNQILQSNEMTPGRTVQISVPNTAGFANFDLMISTKVQQKLVINEVLSNPGGTILDANGEWFEVYNAGSLPVNMKNFLINDYAAAGSTDCELGPNGTQTYCARPSHTITADVIIQPGGYKVFGNTLNTTNNGGVPVDYAYGAALQLANSLDGVRIQSPNLLPVLGSMVIDKTFYASPGISAQNGISRELKNPALDNLNMDNQTNWADAGVSAVYGPGGRGTPRAQNSTFTPFAEPFPRKSSVKTNFTPAVVNSGETVSANLGTIPPNVVVTVTFKVTVPNPIPSGLTQISNQSTVSGSNFGSVMTDDPNTGGADDATVTPLELAPSAAHVFVSGRVLSGNSGIPRAIVSLVDSHGILRTAKTNSFGYFRFDDIPAGQIYVFNASAKGYSFAPQVVSVSDDITELIFTAIE